MPSRKGAARRRRAQRHAASQTAQRTHYGPLRAELTDQGNHDSNAAANDDQPTATQRRTNA
jgi:hypothetical protein